MTTNNVTVPSLRVDEQARARGWRPNANHIIERQIVFSLLNNLLSRFSLANVRVYDGEETVDCGRDPIMAMEIIFDLDESVIKIGQGHWVLIVNGNGVDVISDYGVDPTIEEVVNATLQQLGLD